MKDIIKEIHDKEFKYEPEKGKIFLLFMRRRFPQERSPSYIQEWAGRFKTLEGPRKYMDYKSLEWYILVLEEYAYG